VEPQACIIGAGRPGVRDLRRGLVEAVEAIQRPRDQVVSRRVGPCRQRGLGGGGVSVDAPPWSSSNRINCRS
jgi:hypothetical protein